jgi:hypothetical protein
MNLGSNSDSEDGKEYENEPSIAQERRKNNRVSYDGQKTL